MSGTPQDSPPSTPTNGPDNRTPDRFKWDWHLRNTENGPPIFGTFAGLIYAAFAYVKDFSNFIFSTADKAAKDEANLTIAADITAAMAISNFFGVCLGYIVHKILGVYYRTGKYNITLRSNRPDPAEMKAGEMVVYRKGEELWYIVKDKDLWNDVKGKGDKVVEAKIEIKGQKNSSANDAPPESKADNNESKADNKPAEKTDEEKKDQYNLDNETYQELWRQTNDNGVVLENEKTKLALLKYTAILGHTHSGRTSDNPIYRIIKIFTRLGAQFGTVLSSFLGERLGADAMTTRLLAFVLSSLLALVVGLLAFPYWWNREKRLEIAPNLPPDHPDAHKYDLFGQESWSKYARMLQALFTQAGQAIGGFVVGFSDKLMNAAASSYEISLWGGIMGVIGFLLPIYLVPKINKWSERFRKDKKRILTTQTRYEFRTMYVRTGIILFAGPGALLGLIFMPFALPQIMAATVMSALAAVVGGIAFAFFGHRLFKLLHPLRCNLNLRTLDKDANLSETDLNLASKNKTPIIYKKNGEYYAYYEKDGPWEEKQLSDLSEKEKTYLNGLDFNKLISNSDLRSKDFSLLYKILQKFHSPDIENTYDYGGRACSNVGSWGGALLALFVFPVKVALISIPVFSAIAASGFWLLGPLVVYVARELKGNTIEEKSPTLPWTQDLSLGSIWGMGIGGIAGYLGYFVGIPILAGAAGCIFACTLGAAVGAVVGSLYMLFRVQRRRELTLQALTLGYYQPKRAETPKDTQSRFTFDQAAVLPLSPSHPLPTSSLLLERECKTQGATKVEAIVTATLTRQDFHFESLSPISSIEPMSPLSPKEYSDSSSSGLSSGDSSSGCDSDHEHRETNFFTKQMLRLQSPAGPFPVSPKVNKHTISEEYRKEWNALKLQRQKLAPQRRRERLERDIKAKQGDVSRSLQETCQAGNPSGPSVNESTVNLNQISTRS